MKTHSLTWHDWLSSSEEVLLLQLSWRVIFDLLSGTASWHPWGKWVIFVIACQVGVVKCRFACLVVKVSNFWLPLPHSLINADFCCASSLIAFGALLGKTSPVQMLVVTLFGVTLFAVEEYIILTLLHVSLTGHNHPTWNKIIVQGVRTFHQFLFCVAYSHSAETLVAPWSFTPSEGTMVWPSPGSSTDQTYTKVNASMDLSTILICLPWLVSQHF